MNTPCFVFISRTITLISCSSTSLIATRVCAGSLCKFQPGLFSPFCNAMTIFDIWFWSNGTLKYCKTAPFPSPPPFPPTALCSTCDSKYRHMPRPVDWYRKALANSAVISFSCSGVHPSDRGGNRGLRIRGIVVLIVV